MDPLSDVLSLLKLQTYVAGRFVIDRRSRLRFSTREGLQCYAVVAGHCMLRVDGMAEPVSLDTGDCVVLPGGPSLRSTLLGSVCWGLTVESKPNASSSASVSITG